MSWPWWRWPSRAAPKPRPRRRSSTARDGEDAGGGERRAVADADREASRPEALGGAAQFVAVVVERLQRDGVVARRQLARGRRPDVLVPAAGVQVAEPEQLGRAGVPRASARSARAPCARGRRHGTEGPGWRPQATPGGTLNSLATREGARRTRRTLRNGCAVRRRRRSTTARTCRRSPDWRRPPRRSRMRRWRRARQQHRPAQQQQRRRIAPSFGAGPDGPYRCTRSCG